MDVAFSTNGEEEEEEEEGVKVRGEETARKTKT
jgi:hypothetical protein